MPALQQIETRDLVNEVPGSPPKRTRRRRSAEELEALQRQLQEELVRQIKLDGEVAVSDDLPRVRAALICARGNITYAALALGVTKPWAMVLVRRFQLNEFACELRRAGGARETGRPRRSTVVESP